jgi:hypothetical protein
MQASQARQILLGKRKRGAPDEVRFRPIADIRDKRTRPKRVGSREAEKVQTLFKLGFSFDECMMLRSPAS